MNMMKISPGETAAGEEEENKENSIPTQKARKLYFPSL